MFKRQLYSLYEVKNRSVSEHEAFSFEIQRENLKWLWNANQDFSREMERLNALEDLTAHANLGGAIFKRKAMSPARLYGVGCFGAAGVTYTNFHMFASVLGSSATLFGITAASIAGMINLNEKNVINSIHFVEGGALKINVSSNAFASRDIIVNQNQVQGVLSLGNDDSGETDVDNNIVEISDFVDQGVTVEREQFTLPADAWKDFNTLDWVLSIKNNEPNTDSTEDLFQDLIHTQFTTKSTSGGLSKLELWKEHANYDRLNSETSIDKSIDSGDAKVDQKLQEMADFYGQEAIDRMKPTDFYANYKKFASGAQF